VRVCARQLESELSRPLGELLVVDEQVERLAAERRGAACPRREVLALVPGLVAGRAEYEIHVVVEIVVPATRAPRGSPHGPERGDRDDHRGDAGPRAEVSSSLASSNHASFHEQGVELIRELVGVAPRLSQV